MCAVWSALGGAAAIVLRMIYMGALPMSILFIAGIIGLFHFFNLHCNLAVVSRVRNNHYCYRMVIMVIMVI